MTQQKTLTLEGWILLFVLSAIWGGSFLSNRVVLEEVPVFTVVAFRVVLGAMLLWIWVFSRGLPLPKGGKRWALIALSSVLNNVVPFTLIVWGQQHIESGLAAILNASTAIFAVPLAALIFADEHLTWRKGLGVVIGFFGVATAIGLQNLIHLDLTSTAQLSCLAATLCYAVAAPVARVTLRDVRFDVAAAGMMTAAAIYTVPAALWVEGVPSFGYQATTWAAILYIALASSAVASLLYYRVLGMAGAGNLSLVTLLVAPMAIVLGAVVYGEALPARAFVGFALLAAGLLIINGKFPKVAR